jgi:hypothetical protein
MVPRRADHPQHGDEEEEHAGRDYATDDCQTRHNTGRFRVRSNADQNTRHDLKN